MKIRNGFVSNSSSSSFILSTYLTKKEIKDGKLQITTTQPITESSGFVDNIVSTIDELKDYYSFHWGVDIDNIADEDKEYYKEELDELREGISILEKGGSLILGNCANDDNAMSGFLYSQGFDDVEIINGELIKDV